MIRFLDNTLRDGSHANKHKFNPDQIKYIAGQLDLIGLDVIEVGHGNGLGASSYQIGFSDFEDSELLKSAAEVIKNSKLGAHVIPGIATFKEDVSKAIDYGVSYFRVGSHCTESDTTETIISKIKKHNCEAWGSLMMSHMTDADTLTKEVLKMESYGADGVSIYDSAGCFTPNSIRSLICKIKEKCNLPIGFHAHNNLDLATSNSLAAIESGADFIDGSLAGFGAGAGNLSLPHFASALFKMKYKTSLDWQQYIKLMDEALSKKFIKLPFSRELNVISGIYGVFSGFSSHIERVASQYNVSPTKLFSKCGETGLVAGQEDLIVEIALEISKES